MKPLNAKAAATIINKTKAAAVAEDTVSLSQTLGRIQGAKHVNWGDSPFFSKILDSGAQDLRTKPGSFREDTTGIICLGATGHHFNYMTGRLDKNGLPTVGGGMTNLATLTNLSHLGAGQVEAPLQPEWVDIESNNRHNSWVTYHKARVAAANANVIDVPFAAVINARLPQHCNSKITFFLHARQDATGRQT